MPILEDYCIDLTLVEVNIDESLSDVDALDYLYLIEDEVDKGPYDSDVNLEFEFAKHDATYEQDLDGERQDDDLEEDHLARLIDDGELRTGLPPVGHNHGKDSIANKVDNVDEILKLQEAWKRHIDAGHMMQEEIQKTTVDLFCKLSGKLMEEEIRRSTPQALERREESLRTRLDAAERNIELLRHELDDERDEIDTPRWWMAPSS
ncbi:hypothetical protein VTK56DRAFT_7006 [Thermocarpiscus australiensis]